MKQKQLQAQIDQARRESYEIRRQRLLQLSRQYSTVTEFAAVIQEPVNYVYRMLQDHPKGRKNCGDPKARKIELIFDLQRGWLDRLEGGGVKKAPRPPWPFATVPAELWDSLTPAEKRKAEDSILFLLMGIETARRFQEQQDEEREEG